MTLLLTGSLLFGQQAEDPIREKLRELEERLRRIEQREREETPDPQAQSSPSPQTVEVQELRRQLEVLAEEVERLRSGEPETALSPEQARALGLGPSAARVYGKRQGVSLAGYGEMVYENFDDRDQSGRPVSKGSQLDFLRAILYAGYRFDERFIFNSEIEFEHADTGTAGAVSVEFAYLDYLAHPAFNLRGGLLLVPMGLINEFHEPNVFLGARRTETETRLIPTTWRENGVGFFGSAGMFDYRVYLVNGLRASGFSKDGLRGGRQKGSKAKADDFALVGRLDVRPTPGVLFGGSLYRGGSGQGEFSRNGKSLDVSTTIAELHTQIQLRGWDVRALYARARLDDAEALNEELGLGGSDLVAEVMEGGFVQVGYNLLSQFQEKMALTPYYRYERLNTQKKVPFSLLPDPSRDRSFHTFGLEFRPLHPIVVKADYQWVRNAAGSGLNQFNLALGYSF